jgi:hypothetical protein
MTDQIKYGEGSNPPGPEKHPGRGALVVSLFSVLVSLLFILYGAYIIVTTDGAAMLAGFAVMTILYGVLALVILASAYKFRAVWHITATMISAVSYMLVYVVALVSGVLTGVQLSGFFLVALALWCNWLAVVKVVKGGGAKFQVSRMG